jgi:hypothetical protein
MGSNHKLDTFFRIYNLLILQGHRSRQKRQNHGLPAIAAHASSLALAVAIGTSLDTWLKTGTRYRGHYSFNDKFISLDTDLELTSPTDTAKVETIHQQFTKMIDDYSTAVLPT